MRLYNIFIVLIINKQTMNCSTFTLSAVIAVIYFLCKFFETKYLGSASDEDDEENQVGSPIKGILRDTVMVYACVWIGGFILDQFHAERGGKTAYVPPMVFTDPPNF